MKKIKLKNLPLTNKNNWKLYIADYSIDSKYIYYKHTERKSNEIFWIGFVLTNYKDKYTHMNVHLNENGESLGWEGIKLDYYNYKLFSIIFYKRWFMQIKNVTRKNLMFIKGKKK